MVYEKYIEAWKKRLGKEATEEKRLAEQARRYAMECARILIDKFGAKRVFLFGSLRDGYFHKGSDIDLAVEGLDTSLYLKAFAEIGLREDGFKLDLIPLEDCDDRLAIIKEGELLDERK